MLPRPRLSAPAWIIVGCLSLAPAACTTPAPVGEDAEPAASAADEPAPPELVFITLLPWGEVDFSRGEFPSIGSCNGLVRSLPNFSGYTTPERCERVEDPVYCTGWQDDGASARFDCFKGSGGCEVELKRHDLLAASGARTIAERCQPYSLSDAWAHYQTLTPNPEPAPSAPQP